MTFFSWVKSVFSGSEEASAKRVFGSITLIAMVVLLYFVAHKLIPLDIWDKIEGTVQYIATIGASLLGLNTIIDIYKVARNGKGNGPATP